MPCLEFSLPIDTPPGPGRLALRAGLRSAKAVGGMLVVLTIAIPQALAATGPSGVPAPAAVETDLMAGARVWLAQAHQVSPSAITVQAPDARLQAGACAGGWAFDRPFPQNDTVLRARCPNTQWQLFLSVGLPRGAAPTPAAGTQTAQVPQMAPPVAQAGIRNAPAVQAVNYAAATPPPQAAPTAWAPLAPAPAPAPAPAAASPAPAQAALPLVVRRGHTVVTTWSPAPGLAVSARLESLDDGRVGDMIRVRNRDTGRILGALVSGQGQAVGQ